MKLIWLVDAITDLDEIFDYYITGLEFRSLLVADGKYKLTYNVEDDTVVILVVFSCRQNPAILRIKTLQRI